MVADPNYAPMYGTRTRRVKTDQRDARALAEACRPGIHRLAHRRSEEQRHVTARLAVRDALVRSRTKFICLVRALCAERESECHRVRRERSRRGSPGWSCRGGLRSEVLPLLAAMVHHNEQLAYSDAVVERVAARDDVVQRLSTAPRVGPITAAALGATVDHAERFRDAHRFEAHIGLVPSEMSSGEKQRRGNNTRTAPPGCDGIRPWPQSRAVV